MTPRLLSLGALLAALALPGCSDEASSTSTSSGTATAAGSASTSTVADTSGSSATDTGTDSASGAAPSASSPRATDTASSTDTGTESTSVASATETQTATNTASETASAPPPPVVTAPPPPPEPPPLPPAPKLPTPAAGTAEAVAQAIDDLYVPQQRFTARFEQVHRQKATGISKESSGTVYVEKPNKISFRYDPPNKNRIVSDGVQLKVYIAEDSQMFVRPVEKSEYPGALSFIMGNGLRPSFTFEFNEKAKFDGGPVLTGTPRAPSPFYDNVFFYIDEAKLKAKSPMTVRRVLILDAQGNRNRFDFFDAKQPASIPASEFTFEPPPGTDIK